ncbi:hypothetical protein BKA93DRAFT_563614 [Sparassis latifolia]
MPSETKVDMRKISNETITQVPPTGDGLTRPTRTSGLLVSCGSAILSPGEDGSEAYRIHSANERKAHQQTIHTVSPSGNISPTHLGTNSVPPMPRSQLGPVGGTVLGGHGIRLLGHWILPIQGPEYTEGVASVDGAMPTSSVTTIWSPSKSWRASGPCYAKRKDHRVRAGWVDAGSIRASVRSASRCRS